MTAPKLCQHDLATLNTRLRIAEALEQLAQYYRSGCIADYDYQPAMMQLAAAGFRLPSSTQMVPIDDVLTARAGSETAQRIVGLNYAERSAQIKEGQRQAKTLDLLDGRLRSQEDYP